MKKYLMMTSEEISRSHPLVPTTDTESELRLAKAMGYPATWHVVRIVPHPASHDPKSCMDLIYAGDPANNVDLYYNHNAAFAAALQYEEGVSTGYEAKGGQMLPRKAIFEKGEEVEVDFEGIWYDATIVKVKMYDDDVRYTVHYTEEDSTQANVSEEAIRKRIDANNGKKKRKKRNDLPKSSKKVAKKQLSVEKENSDVGNSFKIKIENDEEEEALALAQKMGLPEGWTSRPRPNHRYYIKSADGKHRFRSRKQALEFIATRNTNNRKKNNNGAKPCRKRKMIKNDNDDISDVSSVISKDDDQTVDSIDAMGDGEDKVGENTKDDHSRDTEDSSSASGQEDKSSSPEKDDEQTEGSIDDSSEKNRASVNLAKSWGLPKGWVAHARSKHRYSIRSPDGTRYHSKMKALESAGIGVSIPSQKKKRKVEEGSKAPPRLNAFQPKEEEGDPPWRRDGHELLGKIIKYNTGDDVQEGQVTGWLDSTDLDSAGEPAFLSERTGTPAALFHVNFFRGDVVFVDLEEYELLECLVPIGEDARVDDKDDTLPLSSILKNKN